MLTDKIAKIRRYKKQLAALEKEVAVKVHKELASLPDKYGFGSMEELIATLSKLNGKTGSAQSVKLFTGRRKRAKITAESKEKVKVAIAAEKTSTQIALELGLSVASVQNIKRELGLVKKRK